MHDFFDLDTEDLGGLEPGGSQSTGDSASSAAAAAGAELRAARQHARLSLRDVAERVGISRGYLSKAENGHLVPSWEMLVRIAAAYGREPRLRLLSVSAGLQDRARAMAAMSPLQRLDGQSQRPVKALEGLVDSGVSFVVTGSVAAVVQGLPMTIDGMTVSVLDDDRNVSRLAHMLMRAQVLFREFDPDEMRQACSRSFLVGWCDVRFDPVANLPAAVGVDVGGLSVNVLPLTILVATDRDVADVFRAVQNVMAD